MRFMKYYEKTKKCLQSFEQKHISLEIVSYTMTQKRHDLMFSGLSTLQKWTSSETIGMPYYYYLPKIWDPGYKDARYPYCKN